MTREPALRNSLCSARIAHVRSPELVGLSALIMGLAMSCGSETNSSVGAGATSDVSSADAAVELDSQPSGDSASGAAIDAVETNDDANLVGDTGSDEDVRGDANSFGDTQDVPTLDTTLTEVSEADASTNDVTAPDVTAPDVTAPDVTAADVTAADVTAPDVVIEDGEPGGPSWTIQGGCAVPLPFVMQACQLTTCAALETCVGNGHCVPTNSFLVDGVSSAVQAYPAVATRDDGAFAVAWAQGNYFEGTQQVVFRVFAAGEETGSTTIAVDGDDAIGGRAPSVTAMADGSWLVLWRSDEFDAGTMSYQARRILSDGSAPAAAAFDANLTPLSDADGSGTNVIAPVVVRLRNDQLIMAWSGTPLAGGPMRIFARLFDADGAATTDDLELSDPSAGPHAASVGIARLPAGLAFVSWQNGVAGTKNDQVVRGRTVDGQGALGPELALSPGLQPYEALPAVGAYDDGELLVTHKVSEISGSTAAVVIRGQLFPAGIEDAPVGFQGEEIVDLDFDANGTVPSAAPVAMLSPERAVTLWQDQGITPRLVWFKRHYRDANVWDCDRTNAGGDPIFNEAGDRFLPALAAWPEGHFVVAYTAQFTGLDETRVAVRILPN